MDWLDSIGSENLNDEYLDVLDVQDEEKDWHIARLGKVTGSKLGKLVVKGGEKGYKLSTGKVAKDLLYKIAWERFLITESDGLNRLNVSSKEMQHGSDYELEAIEYFTKDTGLEVKLGGFNFETLNDYFGGTPDGYIGKDAIIEVKAPWNGGNHLKTLLTGEIYNDDHFYQVQGYMLLTGAKKCYYCTYDPDLPEGIKLAVLEIERDEEVIEAIRSIIDECKAIIEDLIAQVKAKM